MRYSRALERGRAATVRGDLAAAEAAFGEALLARPKDGRALGERGYARLRAKRYAEAEADFVDAQSRPADRILNAQIWFNRGLVAEQEGQTVLARDYFAFSLEANPTAAAKRKLAGKSTCPASVTTPHTAGVKLESFSDFAQACRKLNLLPENEAPAAEAHATNAAVRQLLGIEDCTSGCGLCTLEGNCHLLWEMPDARVAALRGADEGNYYRCGEPPSFTSHPAGTLLWVTSESTRRLLMFCGGCDQNHCIECCADDGPWHRIDYLIEKATLRVLLRVEQAAELGAHRKEPNLTLKDGTLRLEGKGCDWTIPLG